MYEKFVTQAPYREVRAQIFSALSLYMRLLQELVATGRLWLDGGFVTHKKWAPKDVDVALVVDDALINALTVAQQARLLQLLTLQNVHAASPSATARRLQPMGGLVDAFLIPEGNDPMKQLFDATWSRVTDQTGVVVPGVRKGYVEVTW